MLKPGDKKTFAWISLIISIFFFIMGLTHPILQSGYGFGPIRLRQEFIYLGSSFKYFFKEGEYFVGALLLIFTLIFPITKYLFLGVTLMNQKLTKRFAIGNFLDILNKWAMLDVFVVALLILNMKFDSDIIVSELEAGTTYFAISIVLLMITSRLIKKLSIKSV